MPRNTTGGSGHKRSARGEKRGAVKAHAAAFELMDLLMERDKLGLEKLAETKGGDEKIQALRCVQVGRIAKSLGSGWMDVYCQDGKERRCHIRGVLRSKKGGAFMGAGSFVAIALEEPMDNLADSDDEGWGKASRDRPAHAADKDRGFIVGLFDDADVAALQKTRINKRLFVTADGQVMDDLFDYGEPSAAADPSKAEATKRLEMRKGKKGSAAGGGGAGEAVEADTVDLDDL
jgi:hypothetical protein